MAARINALLGDVVGAYVEPFFGSGAVLLSRPQASIELVNDVDGDLIHFYRVLRDPATRYRLIDALVYTPYARAELEQARSEPLSEVDDPIERARRFLVLSNQSYVGSAGAGSWTSTLSPSSKHSNATKWNNYVTRLSAVAERLSGVQVECADALTVLGKVAKTSSPKLALYLDPPYVKESRNGSRYREDGFVAEHHERMLALVRDLPGPTVISGYASELYDSVLTPAHGWRRDEHARAATSSSGRGSTATRVEVLWSNAACHHERE